ncbi:MAG: hypothetical protein JRJ39_03025 [Deltaproteobacteria bacterium]|nr:hypothetical protein [Deltaproteobacteria bacterium]
MKCLIIAAGQGTRFKAKGEVKPIFPPPGVPPAGNWMRSPFTTVKLSSRQSRAL